MKVLKWEKLNEGELEEYIEISGVQRYNPIVCTKISNSRKIHLFKVFIFNQITHPNP